MRIKEINIEQISGKHTVSRDDGKIIYEKIKKLWKNSDQSTINFANLLIASVSFLDEAFGHLALDYSQDELKSKSCPKLGQQPDPERGHNAGPSPDFRVRRTPGWS